MIEEKTVSRTYEQEKGNKKQNEYTEGHKYRLTEEKEEEKTC